MAIDEKKAQQEILQNSHRLQSAENIQVLTISQNKVSVLYHSFIADI